MEREKRREALYVTVPNLFRCPISMDVMKSPVSLCTGVTYDRSSIEKWLALGHKTCPATMQTLPSTHTTPNLTLRRLIHLWLSHADASNLPLPSTVSKQEAAEIVKGEFNAESLEKLIGFMKASEVNLRFIALSNGAISRFVEVFTESDEIRILELIVEVFDLISSQNGVREKLNELILKNSDGRDSLSPFVTVLQKGNTESKAKSAKILDLIALNPESKQKISEKPGILQNLYILTTTDIQTSTEAGLSSLLSIATTRTAKKELIRFGIVRTAARILSGPDPVRGVIEKAIAILETIATCTEGRGAIGEDTECVAEIVRRLMKCSGAATEQGVAVIWSVCCLARDRAAAEAAAKANGVTKVLLVMQSDCSSGTRQMCGELVRVLRGKSGKSNLAPYETRTTHITPY